MRGERWLALGVLVVLSGAGIWWLRKDERVVDRDSHASLPASGIVEATTRLAGPSIVQGEPGIDTAIVKREALELRPTRPREPERVAAEPIAGCRLNGIVLDVARAPLSGLQVSVAQGGRLLGAPDVATVSQTTDSLGRFELDGLAPALWWITVVRPGASTETALRFASEPRYVQVKPGDVEKRVELRVQEGLFLRGHVVGPSGIPARDCKVSATGMRTEALNESRVDEQGAFVLGPLMFDDYRVTAVQLVDSPREVTTQALAQRPESAFRADSETITARAGEEGLVLRMEAAGVLEGIVLMPAGEEGKTRVVEVAQGHVLVDRWRGDAAITARRLSESGAPDEARRAIGSSFSFERLPPGKYQLVATTGSGTIGVQADVLVAGSATTAVELSLQPGAALRVVPDPQHSSGILRAWWGEVLVCDTWIDAHDPTEAVVPAGTLRVEILELSAQPRVLHARSIALLAGETSEIHMDALESLDGGR